MNCSIIILIQEHENELARAYKQLVRRDRALSFALCIYFITNCNVFANPTINKAINDKIKLMRRFGREDIAKIVPVANPTSPKPAIIIIKSKKVPILSGGFGRLNLFSTSSHIININHHKAAPTKSPNKIITGATTNLGKVTILLKNPIPINPPV